MHGIHELQEAGPHVEGEGPVIDDLEYWVEGVNVLQLLVGVTVPPNVHVS